MTDSDRIAGVLIGAAVGDALGLPREGMSRRRAAKMFGSGELRHAFLFGHGMTSDDAEHACMTGQALLEAPHDADAFARSLARRLRWWLLGLPAGTGKATLLGALRLWLGVPPARSGVFSAGNGPAMRAPILGVCLRRDPDRLAQYVRASTRLTHTDPKAEQGAWAAALAAGYAAEELDPPSLLEAVLRRVENAELRELIESVRRGLEQGASPDEFAAHLGLERGVSGYMYHTVPAALFCFLRYPSDFRAAVESVIRLGGDTDSTAALVGALAGARNGGDAIPRPWIEGLLCWPRTVAWMQRLAERLGSQFAEVPPSEDTNPLPVSCPALLARNVLFNGTVFVHVLRRMLPPY
jgi:ADP-ribosyl-[dinitrogen reductase] hydrolase